MRVLEFVAELFAVVGIGFLTLRVAGGTFGIRSWPLQCAFPRHEVSKPAGLRESPEEVCCLSVLQTAQTPGRTLLEEDLLRVFFGGTLPQIFLSGGEDMLRPPRQLTRSRPGILEMHRRW
jgi:hypothetical protein